MNAHPAWEPIHKLRNEIADSDRALSRVGEQVRNGLIPRDYAVECLRDAGCFEAEIAEALAA